MKPGRYSSKLIISLLIVLSAFVFLSTAEAAKEPAPAGQKADLADQSLSIQEVSSEMVAIAIEEYNKALFDAAYKTLVKAKKCEEFLSSADRDKLNKYLQASQDALDKRKLAIEHIRTAKKDIQDDQLINAKAHLKEVEASPFLNAMEKDAVAASLKKIDAFLVERQKQMKQIYDNSVVLYKNNKLAEAREGFIKVAQSGLIEMPDGKTAEDYVHKIDISIGKGVDSLKPSKQPSASTASPTLPTINKTSTKDVNTAATSLPVISSAKKLEISNSKPQIKNAVAEGYLRAVIKDTLAKVSIFLNKGDIPNAQMCLANAEKILNENRKHLDDITFNEYIRILNNLKNKWRQ